ncbi:protoporphyrinogen oxidase [Yimella sp. cx-573]|nr:protoporphyrinogen oxidase [Yimella sp. cx-573]
MQAARGKLGHVVEVAVIGGGIAGLSTAWELLRAGARVTVLESTDRVGGKLRTESIAGSMVDVGAESMLGRRPETRALVAELGLDVVAPAMLGAAVWSRGEMQPMPRGTLMGVPSDAAGLRGLLSDDEVERAAQEQPVEFDGDDISVGDAVEQAFGPAVVDRLVEPLLGGVYAGDARYLSLRACVPQLYDVVREGRSLQEAAAAASRFQATPAAATGDEPPVFAGLRGGIGTLPQIMVDRLEAGGARVRTGVTVTGLEPDERGWMLRQGDGEAQRFDGVVVATPGPAAARLLEASAPTAAQLLRSIEYASMAVITYAFPGSVRAQLPEQSGFLVPPLDGRRIKASTFSSLKWPWLGQQRPDLVYARVSMGRFRDAEALQRPDAVLAADGLRELREAVGELPAPVAVNVKRWGGGLPQYATGHVDLVARIRDEVASLPRISVAGAAYDGVGIPACIGSGRAAARAVHEQLIPSDSRQGRS